jgi:hypothetical protein
MTLKSEISDMKSPPSDFDYCNLPWKSGGRSRQDGLDCAGLAFLWLTENVPGFGVQASACPDCGCDGVACDAPGYGISEVPDALSMTGMAETTIRLIEATRSARSALPLCASLRTARVSSPQRQTQSGNKSPSRANAAR